MDEGASEHPGLRMTIEHKQIFDIVSDYTWDQSETNDSHKRLFPVYVCEEQEIGESTRAIGAPREADLQPKPYYTREEDCEMFSYSVEAL